MPVILALEKLRQEEDHEFQAIKSQIKIYHCEVSFIVYDSF